LLLALWCGFFILFEIPTGILADVWNRKAMLALGMISKAAGFGCWLIADGFWLFALGFLFWGIQETFCSGTQEALLFDNLKYNGKEEDYEKIAGRGHFYSRVGAASSMLLGGFLASISWDLVIALSCGSMILGAFPVLFFRDVRFSEESEKQRSSIQVLKNAFSEARRKPGIMRLFLYTAVFLAVIGILDEYQQIYFRWTGLPLALFGVMMVLRMGLEAMGTRLAYRFQHVFKDERYIYGLPILSGVFIIISLMFRTVYLIPVFSLIFFLGGLGEVIVEARLQRQIDPGQRATMLSMNNFMLGGSAIGLALLFGGLSKIGGATWGFYAFAVLVILYSAGSLLNRKSLKIK
jgi:MFS family permease